MIARSWYTKTKTLRPGPCCTRVHCFAYHSGTPLAGKPRGVDSSRLLPSVCVAHSLGFPTCCQKECAFALPLGCFFCSSCTQGEPVSHGGRCQPTVGASNCIPKAQVGTRPSVYVWGCLGAHCEWHMAVCQFSASFLVPLQERRDSSQARNGLGKALLSASGWQDHLLN